MRRLMSLLPVLLVSVAACGGADQPSVTPSSTTASSPPSTTSSTAPERPTLASLAEQPCLALTKEDTVALNVFIDAREEPDSGDGKSCSWAAQGALVWFTAFPTVDKTQEPDVQHLTVDDIEGRRALIGTGSRGGRTSYAIFVATGPGQSFRLSATSWGEGVPGPDPLTVGKNFAAAILHRLG